MSHASESDHSWSELDESASVNGSTVTDWEVVSQSSQTSNTDASHVSHPLNHVIPAISEDRELPVLPVLAVSRVNTITTTSDENKDEKDEKQETIPEMAEMAETQENKNREGPSFVVASYMDIEAELERQLRIVTNLRQSLNEAKERNAVLEAESNEQKAEIGRLNVVTQRLRRENIELQNLPRQLKYHSKKRNSKRKNQIAKKEALKSKNISKKGGKYHKNAVPAKLKFRRQRSTTRKMYGASRRW